MKKFYLINLVVSLHFQSFFHRKCAKYISSIIIHSNASLILLSNINKQQRCYVVLKITTVTIFIQRLHMFFEKTHELNQNQIMINTHLATVIYCLISQTSNPKHRRRIL